MAVKKNGTTMELENFKAPAALRLAIDTVAQRRSKPGLSVSKADVIRKAVLKDKEIREEYNRILAEEQQPVVK